MHYFLFLRGINVGGIRVPMKELQMHLTGLGLEKVKTYLQSGNVTFDSARMPEDLKPAIEALLTKKFHYEAYVLIVSAFKVRAIMDAYPFAADEQSHRYIIFCQDQAVVQELCDFTASIDRPREEIAAGEQVIYWRAPKGADSNTFFSKLIAKSKYKATVTTRNINTLERMF